MTIKDRLSEDLKDTMRARDKMTLDALRLIAAAVKQIEVDERIVIDDERMLVILDKMVKQRKESITQFAAAKRHDLVDKEQFELDVIGRYLPEPLSESDVKGLIAEAIAAVGAQKMADMGKVMAYIKPKAQGRCDMSAVSALIKNQLQLN
ncbi:MAG: glutamyl-tRNA amidotransferase [Legionellales bacterium RIFCSPHIGHO2_12_FULL_42_9]|nr:MAG: glutamyl-tRNA amidotransferase [Legionellales bacterium RIFCSPHIGHO2_12_FULL_42_9]